MTYMTRRQFVTYSATSLLASTKAIIDAEQVLTSKPRNQNGLARNVILLWMSGGPSQFETFDPKPLVSLRNDSGQWQIPTSVGGLTISCMIPRLADRMHNVCILRTLYHSHQDHDLATQAVLDGWGFSAAEIREGWHTSDSSFISGSGPIEAIRRKKHFEEPNVAALVRRRDLPRSLLKMGSRGLVGETSDSDAADIAERYGRTAFGTNCWIATQMAKQGLGHIVVRLGGWDTHANHGPTVAGLTHALDCGLSGLLDELVASRLIKNTLVVCMGEFGRTPSFNTYRGRDHWPHASCVLLAGCGVPRGTVIGRTDETGHPVADALSALDVSKYLQSLTGGWAFRSGRG